MKKRSVLNYIFIFILGCLLTYGIIYRFPNEFGVVKTINDVTVTDKGIADGVEKVYDAVVIVSSYTDGQVSASGTGFVYKTSGTQAYVLTNNHVISGSSEVKITLTNGNVIDTKVVGSDTLSDIAVLSVEKKDIISVATIGSTDSLRVGDTAFAVGAPLDDAYSWTVTRGIISGKNRMIEVALSSNTSDYVMNVIQTDAAINSGNSGGPLCNANGEVVGITSLKLVDESVEGMGFAIPIETAITYAEKLENGEKIEQPYLGIGMANLATAISEKEYYNIVSKYNIKQGVFIVSVEKGTPAETAGLKQYDVITKINDQEVKNLAFLRYYLYQYSAGDTVNITVLREGKEKVLSAKLTTKSE